MATENSAHLLHAILGLGSTGPASAHDAVTISIDFENIEGLATPATNKPPSGQMGLAILDTRDLYASSGDDNDIIASHNFAFGPPEYLATAQKRFIFGDTSVVKQENLAMSLQSLVPVSRNIALVAHGVSNELRALKLLHIDMSLFVGYFDTNKLPRFILPHSPNHSLKSLLCKLRIPYCNLHSAGNDARFTMLCLLRLATKAFEQHGSTPEASKQKMRYLDQIVSRPLPDAPGRPLTKEEKKKAKQLRKSLR
ncbi:hypothetical protein CC79DRAFT_1362770 [Sarocladium strictum]